MANIVSSVDNVLTFGPYRLSTPSRTTADSARRACRKQLGAEDEAITTQTGYRLKNSEPVAKRPMRPKDDQKERRCSRFGVPVVCCLQPARESDGEQLKTQLLRLICELFSPRTDREGPCAELHPNGSNENNFQACCTNAGRKTLRRAHKTMRANMKSFSLSDDGVPGWRGTAIQQAVARSLGLAPAR